MSLGLHPNCLQSLSEKIAKRLPEIRVQNKMFLESWSAGNLRNVESTIPQTGSIKEKLEQYIGEAPVSDFVYETISKELHQGQQFDSESASIPLTQLDDYTNPEAIAKRLIYDFESLPWVYSLTIKLDNEFGSLFAKSLNEFAICDSLKLITPNDAFTKEFPPQSESESKEPGLASIFNYYQAGFQDWDKSSSYLQFKTNGFIGYYGETSPLRNTISRLKAFCGIGIALHLFTRNHAYSHLMVRSSVLIHRLIGSSWNVERTHDLETDLSEALSNLVLPDAAKNLKSEAEQTYWIQSRLGLIKSVFTHEIEAEKVILASQWLFDSYCGSNELLSFVQMVVAMEILLGDKAVSDLMGLGELLRNRCAYLIGDSQSQREEVLDDFKKIYDLRCQIVHRGKRRLAEEERALFFRFRWMCHRVIHKEVLLLQKDIDRAPLFQLFQTSPSAPLE
jgi:hypothetical protein